MEEKELQHYVNLILARIEKDGATWRELSKQLGISHTTLWRLVRDVQAGKPPRVKPQTIDRLRKAFRKEEAREELDKELDKALEEFRNSLQKLRYSRVRSNGWEEVLEAFLSLQYVLLKALLVQTRSFLKPHSRWGFFFSGRNFFAIMEIWLRKMRENL